MGLAEVKTFENLQNDVISANRCCACGACIAYCENQAFNVIEMDNYTPKFKTDKSVENCKECGYCYYICPQTEPLLDRLKEMHLVKDELGNIIDIKDDLVKSAGTRYSISSNILPLKDLNQVAEDIISQKKRIYDSDQLRLAFIGTPCQCRAISKMKLLNIKPAHVISIVINLFCFENFDYDKLMDTLKSKSEINPSEIKKTNIKKNFFVTSKDDSVKEINIKDLDGAVRNHCHECDEFVGRYSDLSIGSSGAPKGYSMILTRTEKGRSLIDSLLATGYIERYIIPADQISEWQPKKINWLKKMTSLKVKK
jgi:coenzyme F420 hydrogenase subunit beta